MGGLKARRKPILPADVITLDAVQEERSLLRLALSPPFDRRLARAGRRALNRTIADAADVTGLAALIWLKHTQLPVYAALIDAGMGYVAGWATTGKKELRIRKPASGRSLSRWAAAPRLCQLHQLVLAQLQAAWRSSPTPPVSAPYRGVSHRGRHGPKQHRGTQRWQAQLSTRTTAVENVLAELQVPVGPRLARKWVTALRTPGAVAEQIVAHIIGKTPRTAKGMLREARRATGRRTRFTVVPLCDLAFFAAMLRRQ